MTPPLPNPSFPRRSAYYPYTVVALNRAVENVEVAQVCIPPSPTIRDIQPHPKLPPVLLHCEFRDIPPPYPSFHCGL